MMEAIRSSETSILTRDTLRNTEDSILHSQGRKKPQSLYAMLSLYSTDKMLSKLKGAI
jgi:hypothetical protein